jgi:hypothetical protein
MMTGAWGLIDLIPAAGNRQTGHNRIRQYNVGKLVSKDPSP